MRTITIPAEHVAFGLRVDEHGCQWNARGDEEYPTWNGLGLPTTLRLHRHYSITKYFTATEQHADHRWLHVVLVLGRANFMATACEDCNTIDYN